MLRDAGALVPTQRDALLTALGVATGTTPEPFLVALAAANLLASAAGDRQLAISVDDLHWLDPQTQDVLTFLAWRAESGGYVLIGAVRTGHPYAAGAAGLPHLDVTGLDDAAADRLLLAEAGDLRDADRLRIRREARGNPLALLDLPAVWRAPDRPAAGTHAHNLPARLERAFSDRIADMPPVAWAVLLVAALDPADDLDQVLAATTVLAGRETRGDVFDAAVAAGLVSVDGTRLAFRHPLIRSAVVQSESVSRRQAAHGAIAAVIDDAYRRTWHRAQAIVGPDDEIANALEANAAVVLARGAVMSAIGDLERSAELTAGSSRRGHRLLLAAQHAVSLGRVDLVHLLVARASHTDLSDLDRARLEWLREIFDETPGTPPASGSSATSPGRRRRPRTRTWRSISCSGPPCGAGGPTRAPRPGPASWRSRTKSGTDPPTAGWRRRWPSPSRSSRAAWSPHASTGSIWMTWATPSTSGCSAWPLTRSATRCGPRTSSGARRACCVSRAASACCPKS